MSDIEKSTCLLPIGVFDSGMGGLTILEALKKSFPQESFLYLGDTARLPYGTKSRQAVVQYAIQMVDILLERGIKLLVIACNTATTAAIDVLKVKYPTLPIVGVITPGVLAATRATNNNNILLLATETTVRSEIYKTLIQTYAANMNVQSIACGLFVALAEEGFIEGEVAKQVIAHYLAPADLFPYDTVLLGCTHFPVFKSLIQSYVGNEVQVVDSSFQTVEAVARLLDNQLLLSPSLQGEIRYLVTDLPERFSRVGHYFLKGSIHIDEVELVQLINNDFSRRK